MCGVRVSYGLFTNVCSWLIFLLLIWSQKISTALCCCQLQLPVPVCSCGIRSKCEWPWWERLHTPALCSYIWHRRQVSTTWAKECYFFYWIFYLFTFQMLSPFPVSPLQTLYPIPPYSASMLMLPHPSTHSSLIPIAFLYTEASNIHRTKGFPSIDDR